MWSELGKRIQAFFVILLVALLSIVMGVVGFSMPTTQGCNNVGPSYAARVYGDTVSSGEFNAAYRLIGADRIPPERAQLLRARELTLDGLIERKLLVREARRLGMHADGEEVLRRIADDEEVLLGGPVNAPPQFPTGAVRQNFSNRAGEFDQEILKRFIQNGLRRSVDEFTEWQVEETLANQVRDVVTSSVVVSPGEVWDAFVNETERARIRYVRFDPDHYEEQVEVTDDAVRAWMAENAEAVDEEYTRQRHRYTGIQEQVRVRYILVEADGRAEESEREAANNRAEALLAEARGGADFEALARDNSEDDATARRGGDLGWVPRGRRSEEFDEAVFATEPGNVVDQVIENNFGFAIVKVEAHRDAGDVPEDEAKRELSEGLFRTARAAEMAESDAARALTYLRGDHSLEELDLRLRDGWDVPEVTEEAEGEEGEEAEGPPDDPRGPLAPRVEESRPFGRSQRALTSDVDSLPLTRAVYEMSMDEPLPEEPLALGDGFIIWQLEELVQATEDGLTDDVRERLENRLLGDKQREALSAYIGRLRSRAAEEGAIRTNEVVLDYGLEDDEDGASDDEGAEATG